MNIRPVVPRYETAAGIAFFAGLLLYVLACIMSPVAWSPDGRWIALTRFLPKEEGGSSADVGGSELWIISPNPIERRRLMVTSGSLLSAPGWSKDAKNIYILEAKEEESTTNTIALWRVAIDGKPEKMRRWAMTGEPMDVIFTSPAPSPDGRRIALVRDGSRVVVLRSDGQEERVIEIDDAGALAWSPDGTWLTVMRDDEGEGPRVHFFDPSSSETFTLDEAYLRVAWMPDGEHVLAIRKDEDDEEKAFVSTVRVKGGVRVITSHSLELKGDSPLVLAPKSNAVFFARENRDDQPAALLRSDLRTGKSRVLHESLLMVVPQAVSPDGRRLAFRVAVPGKEGNNDPPLESVVGVLDIEGKAEPLYLAVDDKQWVAMVRPYVDELQRLAPALERPRQRELARLALRRLARFMSAFRRDFPKSPLLAECKAECEKARAALKTAGVELNSQK